MWMKFHDDFDALAFSGIAFMVAALSASNRYSISKMMGMCGYLRG
jgi:hypothetical protein